MKENNSYLAKKEYEINCVRHYFKNTGIEHDDIILEKNFNNKEDDSVDVYYLDKKFQVTFSDGWLEGERRKIVKTSRFAKLFHWRNVEDAFRQCILESIINKGKNLTMRLILLIDGMNGVSFIGEEYFKGDFRNLALDANLEQYCFEEIILVCPNKNYKIFPIEDINRDF